MKFIVTRTSSWAESPCEEAKRDSVVYVETRSLHSPEEYNKKFIWSEGDWFSTGTNHRVDEKSGYIQRDREPMDVWSVEIDTLEELIEFCNKYGNLVVKSSFYFGDNYHTIEIYDDYRE